MSGWQQPAAEAGLLHSMALGQKLHPKAAAIRDTGRLPGEPPPLVLDTHNPCTQPASSQSRFTQYLPTTASSDPPAPTSPTAGVFQGLIYRFGNSKCATRPSSRSSSCSHSIEPGLRPPQRSQPASSSTLWPYVGPQTLLSPVTDQLGL